VSLPNCGNPFKHHAKEGNIIRNPLFLGFGFDPENIDKLGIRTRNPRAGYNLEFYATMRERQRPESITAMADFGFKQIDEDIGNLINALPY
jgi:hypothetical protein